MSSQEIAEVQKEMDRAYQRVEELEIEGDMTKKRMTVLEAEREAALAKVEDLSRDAEANAERADRAEKELEGALERMAALEAQMAPLEARAAGLSNLLSGIGRNVAEALKDTEVADGNLTIFDQALEDKENLQVEVATLETEKVQAQEQVETLGQQLTLAEKRAKLLDAAEERAKKLSEGLQTILEKSGAGGRRGLLGAIFGRSEEEMIQDTLDQIDDLKARGER